MDTLPACPVCGSPTRIAFDTTTDYVTCRRNGHVSLTNPA